MMMSELVSEDSLKKIQKRLDILKPFSYITCRLKINKNTTTMNVLTFTLRLKNGNYFESHYKGSYKKSLSRQLSAISNALIPYQGNGILESWSIKNDPDNQDVTELHPRMKDAIQYLLNKIEKTSNKA